MKRILVAVAATLGLLVSTGQAAASGPADSALELAAQAVASAQAAGAQSGASQSGPANGNISVRVQSPGDTGDVKQSNTVVSGATATNANLTGQSANQSQSGQGCCGGGGTQAVGQDADSSQAAAALSHAVQHGASNENIDVRVQSPGDAGNVSQSNTVVSGAAAGNANAAGQSANQTSAGGSGTQAVGQDADNEQAALAASSAEQAGAKNSNISVRVQSRGDDGDVEQSNTVASAAKAVNLNGTKQGATQAQGGSGGTQAVGQDAKSDQTAAALSGAKQVGAKNEHIAVRVQSPGKAGKVEQSNTVLSGAAAGNLNATSQNASQAQGGDCKCSDGGTQAIGQDAKNHQGALAISGAEQIGATNAVTPVRIDSRGDDGDVEQSNTAVSTATAANLNGLEQEATQRQAGGDCKCSGGTQAIGQDAKNEQAAGAISLAAQLPGRGHDCRCDKSGGGSGGNSHSPVRVDSSGGGGKVEQSNTVASGATALNLNSTKQEAGQGQSGGGIQAVGQEAESTQGALAVSLAGQIGASNSSSPVRVDSRGDDGRLKQSNTVLSAANAGNANRTDQGAEQVQRGACGCHGTGVQAIGQKAKNEQLALGISLALQAGASNESSPVRVDSDGGGGSLEQSNDVVSYAGATNLNHLGQLAGQGQAGGGGTAVQAIGQKASNQQAAIGLSAALQLGASNSHAPVWVDSEDGKRGKDSKDRRGRDHVSQSNGAVSGAKAANGNATGQLGIQLLESSCRCSGAPAIQALGQEAKNDQLGLGASLALQCGASNGPKPSYDRRHPDSLERTRRWKSC
jgi:hypothetical protein